MKIALYIEDGLEQIVLTPGERYTLPPHPQGVGSHDL